MVIPQRDARSDNSQQTALLQLDQLISSLDSLRIALAQEPWRSASAHKAVATSFVRLDEAMSPLTRPSKEEDCSEGDPLSDRLRNALIDLMTLCVRNEKDRYICIQLLGLSGDGRPLRLSDVAEVLGVTRERIRQRRNRGFALIRAMVRRRIASCERLRTVLHAISVDADWRQPREVARHVVRLIADRPSVVKELSLMCCLAAGWEGEAKELHSQLQSISVEECRNACTETDWRLDTWAAATERSYFPCSPTTYQSFPADLLGRKREPGERRDFGTLLFHSDKLSREVACESATEYRVMTWLENAQEVIWYQEQPTVVPYTFGGKERRYFPDVAVLARNGHCYIIEVKPIFGMYRELTLVKTLACLEYVGTRGMGYLLVDQRGRTLSDYADVPYDPQIADEIEALIGDLGRIKFPAVRDIFMRRLGKMSAAQFISMTLNRDWSVTEGPGVTIGRLANGISFSPLLSHLPRLQHT